MLSKCSVSFEELFCESKMTASYPSSSARALADSANKTNQGLFKVDITTAIRFLSVVFGRSVHPTENKSVATNISHKKSRLNIGCRLGSTNIIFSNYTYK